MYHVKTKQKNQARYNFVRKRDLRTAVMQEAATRGGRRHQLQLPAHALACPHSLLQPTQNKRRPHRVCVCVCVTYVYG